MFFRRTRQEGWRAITFQGSEVREIRAVHVRRTSAPRPLVTMIASERIEGATPVERLTELARQWQGERYHCTTMLREGEYRILPVDTPNVPQNELRPAMTWLIKDMIDYHVDEATIDVLTVPADKFGQKSRVMYAVATRKKNVSDLQAIFEEADVALEVIDIPELAQRNISALLEVEDRGVALLYFDDDSGILTFTAGGELYLSRRIGVTLYQLQQYDADARQAAQERVALEVQRSLDHFSRQFNAMVLSRLIVAPMGEENWGFPEYLGANLDIKVESLNLELLFDIEKVPDLKNLNNQQRYFLPLGLALRLEEKAL